MTLGVYLRKKRSVHIKLMATTIIWDILLILQIELGRGAIIKASNAVSNAMMLNVHVSIAVLTVFFYGGMIYTGRKLLSGDNSIKPLHKKLGWTTWSLRILTFVTSFWAVTPQ
jgi:arginine exporter protein ArgO